MGSFDMAKSSTPESVPGGVVKDMSVTAVVFTFVSYGMLVVRNIAKDSFPWTPELDPPFVNAVATVVTGTILWVRREIKEKDEVHRGLKHPRSSMPISEDAKVEGVTVQENSD